MKTDHGVDEQSIFEYQIKSESALKSNEIEQESEIGEGSDQWMKIIKENKMKQEKKWSLSLNHKKKGADILIT